MSVVCDNKCCGGAKKPERTLRTATACAFWLSIAIILLARSQLASTQHSNKLHKCDDDSCSAPHSLRGAQNLLHAAAHHLTQQHRHAAGASAAVQLVADEAADVGKRQLDVTGKEQLQAGPIAQKPRSGAAASASGSELQAAAARQQVAKTHGGADEDSAAAASLASSEQERPAPRHEGDAAAVVAAHAAIGAQGQAADQVAGGGQPSQPSAPSPYQLALQGCSDLLCLQRAAALDRHPGQFMFPHFFIVGWQKCATTSLFFHLSQHPAVLRSSQKEPEFFSNECGYSTADCAEEAQKRYISKTLRLEEALEGDLQRSTVEASTHYGRNGHLLAHPLHELMPWLKIVISMREPISRGISMLAHQLDKHDSGCLTSGKSTFHCLERSLTKEGYAKPFQAWLEAYPGQIFLIQYENLTSSEHQVNVLHGLKHWLGIDPELPNSDLGIRNTREYHLKRKGQLAEAESEEANSWPMERGQYESLVDLVRPDAQKVADLAAKYGLADGKVWMRNWEREWQGTLDRCDEDGACIVFPS